MSDSPSPFDHNSNLRYQRGRYAVLLVTAPPFWVPHGPSSLPPSIVSARFMVRHCRCLEASAAAQAFNRSHCGREFNGEWALVVSAQRGVVGSEVAHA